MPTIKKVLFIISRLLLVGVIVGYLSLDFGYFVQESYFLGTTFGGSMLLDLCLGHPRDQHEEFQHDRQLRDRRRRLIKFSIT